ncbi:MAG: GGDEF domain-containing protein [Oscillospiraceae bacterium]|nr:GGDEF domain-containing protein [Oscillospiraceae bacterium]
MDRTQFSERLDQIMKDYRRDHKRQERELKKCLKEAEKDGDAFLVGKINLYLSMCCFELGDRVGILPYAFKAVGIFENTKEYSLLTRSYNLLGIAYVAQGNLQLSLDMYNKALKIIRERKKVGLRREVVLNNIAESYYQMGEYQKSIGIMKSCLSTCRRLSPDNHISISIYGLNLSDCYEILGNYKKSWESLDTVENNIKMLGKNILVCGYYARRACVSYGRGDAENGAKYADLALSEVQANHDTFEFHRDFEKIAMMEVQSGDYERAQRFADILSEYADKNGHTIDKIVSRRVQANISDSTGDRDRALALYKELSALYEQRRVEENAMQYESRKNAEAATREISKLMKKIRLSEERAERDPLTGLLNRSALVTITNEFIQNAKEKGRRLGGIFMDIDYFKEYNDTYGHAAGDEAIKFVSNVCMGEETSTIRFFRYGGDEFFGIVLGHTDKKLENLALHISEKIRSSGFEHSKNPNGQKLTVSIGVVNINMKSSESTILDIIKYADKALYHAKDRGKNAVFAFHAMPNSEHEYRRISAESFD